MSHLLMCSKRLPHRRKNKLVALAGMRAEEVRESYLLQGVAEARRQANASPTVVRVWFRGVAFLCGVQAWPASS